MPRLFPRSSTGLIPGERSISDTSNSADNLLDGEMGAPKGGKGNSCGPSVDGLNFGDGLGKGNSGDSSGF
jgi:hypothetical protein